MITFFGYKNCSTCRSAEKLLHEHKVAYAYVDITTKPPTAEQLTLYVKNSGLDVRKFLNTSGEVYRTLGLKDKLPTLTPAAVINLMASNGRLIKRPLIVNKSGTKVSLGGRGETLSIWLDEPVSG